MSQSLVERVAESPRVGDIIRTDSGTREVMDVVEFFTRPPLVFYKHHGLTGKSWSRSCPLKAWTRWCSHPSAAVVKEGANPAEYTTEDYGSYYHGPLTSAN